MTDEDGTGIIGLDVAGVTAATRHSSDRARQVRDKQ
jgi:hypothetical protein